MDKQEYTGAVYIAVTGPEDGNEVCRDSIEAITRRPGDAGPFYGRGTKGYEVRQQHLNKFIASPDFGFILYLDRDMVYPPDTLERLRNHKLPFVSGLYMRRMYSPVAPIWFKPWSGEWPLEPWMDPIERGKLHEIGASGWGCMLVHREVIEKTRPLLKGEAEILEDDMDLWPYDLPAMMWAIRSLRAIVDHRRDNVHLWAALDYNLGILESELRPNRGSKHDCIGSDIRFPWYAREAGYPLYGDPDANCSHDLHYPISINDFDGMLQSAPPEALEGLRAKHTKMVDDERQLVRQAREVCGG